MNLLLGIVVSALTFAAGTSTSKAVPPPDFIFNIGSQLIQIFSIVAVFLSAAAISAGQVLKVYFLRVKHKKMFWAALGLVIVLASFGVAYGFQQYVQQRAYRDWIAQSVEANQQAATGEEALKKFEIESQKNIEPEQARVAAQTVVNVQPAGQKVEATQIKTVSVIDAAQKSDFFEKNQALPVAISNGDFQKILDSKMAVVVLDAREKEEYDIGNFPGSLHIRFADLLDGKWMELPKDQVVYVFCWSGMRGREVADFLRSKKIVARYIEKGASDWVASGGTWNGGISFLENYPGGRYTKLFDLDEMKKQITDGTVIVDCRPEDKFAKHNIKDSINIPIIYTTSSKIEEALSQIPAGKKVITVCDDFISCFDAKITGVKLEKNGAIFLGRYNKPWEYQN